MAPLIRRTLLASTLLAGVHLASPAAAQVSQPAEAAPPVQEGTDETGTAEVVVTGTRIARPDLTTASPVSVVGLQEIQFRQPATADDLLRTLPAIRLNLGRAVNNGSDGSASIDLRGIGTNRMLVLVDGRRVVPFGLDNIVDTNVVPVALLERVEVVTGGASTVYGADAVAGVVNFITRRNFEGFAGQAQYAISDRGDANQIKADLTTGSSLVDGNGDIDTASAISRR